jgi:hypothetical protein
MAKVTFEWPDDETLAVLVDGQRVASACHDEHGWAGIEAVTTAVVAVAKALGAEVDGGDLEDAAAEDETDDDDVIVVDHGPVKPPYGSPERAAYDAAQVPDDAIGTSPQAERYRDAHGLDPGQVC